MGLQSFMRQFTIRLRMLGAVGFVLATLVAVGLVGWFGMSQMANISHDFSRHSYHETVTLGKLRLALAEAELNERNIVIKFANPDDLNTAEKGWKESLALSRDFFNGMLEGEEDEDNPLVRENIKDLDAYIGNVGPVIAKIRSGSYFTADSVAGDMKPAEEIIARINGRMEKVADIVAGEAASLMGEQDVTRDEMLMYFVVAIVIAMVMVAPSTIANMNSICRPLDEAKRMASAIADGDLRSLVRAEGKDEINELMQALDNMQSSLVRIVNEVRNTTDGINNASVEIASGNQDLSMRTEQAASNLQQTAASMDQINTTVQHSADSARQAAQMAVTNADVATKGGQVVAQVVSTMDAIHHSSQKINDIIGVIDGIAFQTNILALNAAVEAARAGEQGRGFAVVAGEVRSLAQRSAEAARQIKSLIEASVEKVSDGSRLVADAGSTINEIVVNAGKVSELISDIRRATDEQSTGMGQVNTAVSQLDSMTQQNAALVEESAAAAASLKDQAQRLSDLVQVFRLP